MYLIPRERESAKRTIFNVELQRSKVAGIDAHHKAQARHNCADGCHRVAERVIVGRIVEVGRDVLGRLQRRAVEERLLLLLGQVRYLVHGDGGRGGVPCNLSDVRFEDGEPRDSIYGVVRHSTCKSIKSVEKL